MGKDKGFEKDYSINIARLKQGESKDEFVVGDDFFEHFPNAPIEKAQVDVQLTLYKNTSHIDVRFVLTGKAELMCDRCGDGYEHRIDARQRVFYSFDEHMKFDGQEVVYVDPQEPELSVAQEIYDFINLAIPMRKVPEKAVHVCAPDVLARLGLDADGNEIERAPATEEEEVDPRWEALKDLRKKMDE